MSLSMYDVSVPVFVRMLNNLAKILEKGAASAQARGIDPLVLTSARLAPDMHPLSRQVQIACDAAKGAVARLTGTVAPVNPDTETSFDELQTRIATTIAYVNSVGAEAFEGSESRSVTLQIPGTELTFTGQVFLLNISLPNLYFHISTAYDILRHNGVAIGKFDFLGGV